MHSTAFKFRVFIIVASFFTILAYIYLLAPTTPLLDLHLPFPTANRTHTHEIYAYATFLGPPTSSPSPEVNPSSNTSLLDDPYFVSVRLLNYQIQHAEQTKTRIDAVPFLVLVLSSVPAGWTAMLEDEGATIVHIEPLDLPDAFDKDFINSSRFRDVLAKLRLWQLTNYDKILYLDADSFLLQNLDGLFTDPNLSTLMKTLPSNSTSTNSQETEPPKAYLMAASTDTYGDQTEWEEPGHVNYLCACFMLLSPSLSLFNYYLSVLAGPDAPPNAVYPEQDLLIYVHRTEGRMPWKRIPIEWSANDGEMNDELMARGGVKSLHVKGWEGAEGGNVAGERYKELWRRLVQEMKGYYGG